MPGLIISFRKPVVALLILLVAFLAACSTGPMDPGRLTQLRSRDEYITLARQHVAHDEIYFLNQTGEALWLDALSLTPELLAAGQARWKDDKRYQELLNQWRSADKPGQTAKPGQADKPGQAVKPDQAAKPGQVVLVGLYTRGLTKDDILVNGRFRFQLLSGGQLLEPLAILEVKPEIWADYFPVFTRWEKVFALRFPVTSPGGVLSIHWPQGSREVILPTLGASAKGSSR
ncbi:MAG: hypothetical protein LBT38_09025 [Deltaproteobacteria bacterium]|jgi:hypothetical protein|nr:hypothetical protein [Deltaproteobacteria bacterium]